MIERTTSDGLSLDSLEDRKHAKKNDIRNLLDTVPAVTGCASF